MAGCRFVYQRITISQAGSTGAPAPSGRSPNLMSRNFVGGLFVILLAGFATPSLANDLVGSGAIGARGGSLLFTKDAWTKQDAKPRLSGDLVFSYAWTDNATLDVTAGYARNPPATGNPEFYVATSTHITLGSRYFLRDGQGCRPCYE